MNFLFDIDNQTQLIGFAFFLALFLFSLGVSQFFRQRSERRDLIGKNSRRRNRNRPCL